MTIILLSIVFDNNFIVNAPNREFSSYKLHYSYPYYATLIGWLLGLPFGGNDYITEEDIDSEEIKILRGYKASDIRDKNEE